MGGTVQARTLRIAVLALVLSGVAALATSPLRAASIPPPNIVVIITDDQRAAGTMQVMPKTRNWFYAGGTKFKNAYATTPLCCPSRASIFSGRYAHNHGQHLNTGPTELDASTTIERYLQQAGYRTALIGKYLNTWPLDQAPPFFDYYDLFEGGAYINSDWNLNGTLTNVHDYATTFMTDRAVNYIHQADQGSQPWFLVVAISAPHAPARAEDKYRNAKVGDFVPNKATKETDISDKPLWWRNIVQLINPDPKTKESIRTAQLRTLLSADDMVGRIRAALGQDGVKRNTLAFFLSDNGLLWGEHGGLVLKDIAYLPSVQIPMAMSWPGHVTAGRIDKRLVGNIDIAPTIAAAVGGIVPNPPMDGRSLLDRTWTRTRLLLEYFGITANGVTIPPWSSEVTSAYQYIESTNPGGAGVREYYDRANDPFEILNLLGDSSTTNDPPAAVIQAIHQQLQLDLSCSGPTCP